jgi:hypothetical protein
MAPSPPLRIYARTKNMGYNSRTTPVKQRTYNNLHRFDDEQMCTMIRLNNTKYLAKEEGDDRKLEVSRIFVGIKRTLIKKGKINPLIQTREMKELRKYLTETGVMIGVEKAYIDFENVPDFIVEACFSKSRNSFIIVISYCIVNGLDIRRFLQLTTVWINFDSEDWKTCVKLIKTMLNDKSNYFSHCYYKGRIETLDNKFMFIDGKRVVATHYNTYGFRMVSN